MSVNTLRQSFISRVQLRLTHNALGLQATKQHSKLSAKIHDLSPYIAANWAQCRCTSVVNNYPVTFYGHGLDMFELKDDTDWTKRCTTMEVDGVRQRGHVPDEYIMG